MNTLRRGKYLAAFSCISRMASVFNFFEKPQKKCVGVNTTLNIHLRPLKYKMVDCALITIEAFPKRIQSAMSTLTSADAVAVLKLL